MGQNNITTLYSKPGCGPCMATERQFKQHGIEYKKIDVTQDPEALKYVTETLGYQSVPVVEAPDGTHWSGYQQNKIAALNQERTNLKADSDLPGGRVTVIAQSRHIDIGTGNITPGGTHAVETAPWDPQPGALHM